MQAQEQLLSTMDALRRQMELAFAQASSSLDEDKVRAIVNQALAEHKTTIKVVTPELPEGKDVGVQHKVFPRILNAIAVKKNVWLYGPASTGKTYVASSVAEALNQPFAALSVGAQTGKHEVFGYVSATGEYIGTDFRRLFETGGVFLFDEIDTCNPKVIKSINATLSSKPGQKVAFPDGMVERHPDFVGIAAANTVGTGASRTYIGGTALDISTLDRFVFIHMDYDNELELALYANTAWVRYIHAVRAECNAKGVMHVVGRALEQGEALLSIGEELDYVIESCVCKYMDDKTRKQLESVLFAGEYYETLKNA